MMLRILVFLSLVTTILCAEQCLDGRLCPDGNTCCCAGGCIASDLGRYNATCCGDGLTGCFVARIGDNSARVVLARLVTERIDTIGITTMISVGSHYLDEESP